MNIDVLLVGGPLDGETVQVSDEYLVYYVTDTVRRWFRPPVERHGHYRPDTASDYLSGVWKWQGWET